MSMPSAAGGAGEEAADVVIVGSGFAGSILARVLATMRRGVGTGGRIVLLERGRHPRFALGESSTPLAAVALERLARRYDLPDLRAMAAHGRWLRELPGVGRGLKRGFTFLAHRPGAAFDPALDGRLLVAASPSDAAADSHWLRSEVDAHLVARAVAAGVDFRDGVELDGACERDDGVSLRGRRGEQDVRIRARFVVDATGAGGFLARHLPIVEGPPSRVASSLLFGHFEGVVPLAEAAGGEGALGPPGPYPDERAAVHHLIAEGWMYALPFDRPDGGPDRARRVSVGVELVAPSSARSPPGPLGPDPEAALRSIVARYPTLAAQLGIGRGGAHAVEPVRFVPRVQHRLARAAGRRWLLLPHAYAFTSPLFSTGIAWSLVAVERAARLLEGGDPPAPEALVAYQSALEREAEWIDRLVAGAFRSLRRFDVFAAWSLLYFAAASFAEASQRLIERPDEPWCLEPFLGAGDPVLREVLAEAERRLPAALAGGRDAATAFRDWLLGAIGPRDLCGFARPERRGLHPVDLDALVAGAHLLGLDRGAVRAALPRLRGDAV